MSGGCAGSANSVTLNPLTAFDGATLRRGKERGREGMDGKERKERDGRKLCLRLDAIIDIRATGCSGCKCTRTARK